MRGWFKTYLWSCRIGAEVYVKKNWFKNYELCAYVKLGPFYAGALHEFGNKEISGFTRRN